MFLHYTTIKFLTTKRLSRENFSFKALVNGKKPSLSPLLSLFSSLRIMRALCLLPLLAVAFPLLAQNMDKSKEETKNTAQTQTLQEQGKNTAQQEEKNYATTEQTTLLPPAFGQIAPEPANIVDAASNRDIPPECKNLRRVRVIDELLYQMYSNLDSQCLFEISTEKLEEIWGIPVLDDTQESDIPQEKWREKRRKKFTKINNDTVFFIRKSHLDKDINKEKYLNFKIEYSNFFRHYYGMGGSLRFAKFPYYLPAPKRYANDTPELDIAKHNLFSGRRDVENSDYQNDSFYYWTGEESQTSLPILIIFTGYTNTPFNVQLFQYQSDILEYLKKRY